MLIAEILWTLWIHKLAYEDGSLCRRVCVSDGDVNCGFLFFIGFLYFLRFYLKGITDIILSIIQSCFPKFIYLNILRVVNVFCTGVLISP